MKTCFLLGSGISLPAKLPSVNEITNQVLSIYTGKVCSLIENPLLPDVFINLRTPEREKIEHFLRWLKSIAESRYSKESGRQVNYEDLVYLTTQIRDDLLDEYENPALAPLIHCARKSLLVFCSVCDGEPDSLARLAGQTLEYITEVIIRMLGKNPEQLEHLRLFRDAAVDHKFGEFSLFTLNHDCLLEKFFFSENLDVIDGFNKENDLGIRIWNPENFDDTPVHSSKPTVRLFKLHGSIDWRRFRPLKTNRKNPWSEEYVGIRSNVLLIDTKDEKGRKHEEFDRSLFLMGSFNKMQGYLNHVFLELHYRFHRTLATASRLVVCGYGFGDKGINNRITDWMCLSPKSVSRKIILIDPKSFGQVCETARGAIGAKLHFWKEEGRFIHFPYCLGDDEVNWGIVRDKLTAD